jgi:hypothetical protein
MPKISLARRNIDLLKVSFTKWRIAFILFAVIYFLILLLNLVNQPFNWDEATHLNRALELNNGLFHDFVRDSFYPPLFSCFTALSFNLFEASLFSARLVSAAFTVFTLFIIYELTKSMYSEKTALLSSVLLAVMPGYFWLARLALIEVTLVFFFTLSLFFFYRWLTLRKNYLAVLSGLALGFGFLAKYQIIAAVVCMAVSMLLLGKDRYKWLFSRFSLLIAAALAVIIPWLIIAYNVLSSYVLSQWVYALQMGNPGRSLYSTRFPIPIFYFVELVWPYPDVHPISLILYIVGLLGLGYLVLRKKKEDKFVFAWFITVFVFFTVISNREWRYVLTLFPALAISASVLILVAYDKFRDSLTNRVKISKKAGTKIATGLLIGFLFVTMGYSVNDIYYNVEQNSFNIEIKQATDYLVANGSINGSIIVLCPFNYFSQDMVKFYLWAAGKPQIQTYQYPTLPVDTYTPKFNITEFIEICEQYNVEFVYTYENGGTTPYFNTTLSLVDIYIQIYASKAFSEISPQMTFGETPRRVIVLTFIGDKI